MTVLGNLWDADIYDMFSCQRTPVTLTRQSYSMHHASHTLRLSGECQKKSYYVMSHGTSLSHKSPPGIEVLDLNVHTPRSRGSVVIALNSESTLIFYIFGTVGKKEDILYDFLLFAYKFIS